MIVLVEIVQWYVRKDSVDGAQATVDIEKLGPVWRASGLRMELLIGGVNTQAGGIEGCQGTGGGRGVC
jgi:hypothetical protein